MKLSRHLWYIKRGEKIEGPFPAKQISQWILLGRLRTEDHVSQDGLQWHAIATMQELIPAQLKADLNDPIAKERLQAARRWQDDRGARERRDARGYGATPDGAQRIGGDRRDIEDLTDVNFRLQREARIARDEQTRPVAERDVTRRRVAQFWAIVLAVSLVGGVLIWLAPKPVEYTAPNCHAPAGARVNWNLCSLQAAQLSGANIEAASLQNANFTGAVLSKVNAKDADFSYANASLVNFTEANLVAAKLVGTNLRHANLTGADLSGADLSYADLSDAILEKTNLTGAKFDKAIWFDYRTCGLGSVGNCN